jgi:D-glycero-alpha-D-manno-heptose-7-phosphate kinase
MVRSPLRITLGGGGTDLPAYANQFGGFSITAAISKYCYVGINHLFKEGIFLKYSEMENIKLISDIKHPVIRESLKSMGIKTPQLEIISIGDVPSNGAGLGNSGAFSVALLKAISCYKNMQHTQEEIANLACNINMVRLGKIQGAQDEYASSIGGITGIEFRSQNDIYYYPITITHDTIIDLEENLTLFYTGINHDTQSILKYQEEKTYSEDFEMIENLHKVKQVGMDALELLEFGKTKDFGELLNIQWKLKEDRMPTKNSFLEELHYGSLEHGAIGSKLIGSGMGGFIMCYAENKNKLRQYMKSIGLEELRFSFDFEGCKRMV